jgi:hypothetical protein
MIIRLGLSRAFSLWPLIFAPRNAPVWILEHERAHYHRQAWITPVWVIRWLFDAKFRYREEQLAFKAEIESRRAAGRYAYLHDYAFMMSTQYRGMCTYEQAMEWLRTV